MDGQFESARTEIAYFDGGVSVEFALHAERPGQDLRHHRIIDKARRELASRKLRGRSDVRRRQPTASEETRAIRSGTPHRLRGQSTGRLRIQFALQLWRQRNRREVLEFYVIGNSEAGADGSFAATSRVEGKANPRSDIILVGSGHGEGDYARNAGNGVQALRFVTDGIGPVFVAETQIQSELRSDFEVVLREYIKGTLRTQEAAGPSTAQGPAGYAGEVIIH